MAIRTAEGDQKTKPENLTRRNWIFPPQIWQLL